MANNRLALRCKVCGDFMSLARVGIGSMQWDTAIPTEEVMDRWLKTHTECGGDFTLRVNLDVEWNHLIDIS